MAAPGKPTTAEDAPETVDFKLYMKAIRKRDFTHNSVSAYWLEDMNVERCQRKLSLRGVSECVTW